MNQKAVAKIALAALLATGGCISNDRFGGEDLVVSSVSCGPEVIRFDSAKIWSPDGFRTGDFDVSSGRILEPGDCGRPDRRVDLGGYWLTPPFGDAHSHQLESPFLFEQFNHEFIRSGIYYVKNPNAHADLAAATREKAEKPGTVDVAFSMGGITSRFGHPQGGLALVVSQYLYPGSSRDDLDGLAFHSVDALSDIGPVIDRLVEQEADFVKVYLHYSEEYEDRRALVTEQAVADGLDYSKTKYLFGLDPALVEPIVAASHDRGLPVVAHITTAEDLRIAVNAGVDQLGHLPGAYATTMADLTSKRLSGEDIALIASSGVTVTATYNARPDLTPEALRDELAELQRSSISRLVDAGVSVFLGADAFDQNAADEYRRWSALNALDSRALLELWIETGRNIFPDRKIGRIEPGYEASFLVFSADPGIELNALSALERRVMQGTELVTPETDE